MPNNLDPHTHLAIVGMSCRLPGAEDLEAFWRLIRDGASAFSPLPAERIDPELYYSPERGAIGACYSRMGGLVGENPEAAALCPDPESCDISHRILLDVAAGACRDAGWDPLDLPWKNAGVYIGHARTGPLAGEMVYSTHIEECVAYLDSVPAFEGLPESVRRAVAAGIVSQVRNENARHGAGGKPLVRPGRAAALVAETLGLTGPGMVVDAACASSLVALVLAAGALRSGRIDMAVVGGASYSNWHSMVLFARAQALSAAGSFPFDERADGFISSDGYAAVIVKTLARALADGDRIHGVVRGLGLSSDGRGKSLWAPRREGQIAAIQRAYPDDAGAWRLDYIEAHGTSTQLGDATELESLHAGLGSRLPEGARVPIASVKGNIGHTCEAAGVAGLIKTLLAMRHGVIPPAAGFEIPNPAIAWAKLPFFVPQSELPWPAPADGQPRRAAIDAFGIGGLNVHAVVEDAGGAGTPACRAETRLGAPAVAIVGAGAVFPGAKTAAAFWDLIASGADLKTAVPPDRWDAGLYCTPGHAEPFRSPVRSGGFVTDFKYDWRKHRVPPKQLEIADPLQFMLLDAADQALVDAGYDHKPFDRTRAAVVVGTIFNGDFARQLTVALSSPAFERELARQLCAHGVSAEQIGQIVPGVRKILLQRKTMLRDDTGGYSASTLASRIARTLDLMGGAFAVDAEEASSGAALESAVDLLRTGACDLVLCAGAQRSMDISIYEEYGLRGLLSEGDGGFVLAEGAGIVVLKRLEDARRAGDRIRGIVNGIHVERKPAQPAAIDAVTRQMGHALGASGMASLLGALGPANAGRACVTNGTPDGLQYRVEIERPRLQPAKPRMAFLFPGQGSQYTGMLRDLVAESPAAAAKLREIDAIMARLGHPSFSEIAWKEGAGLGTDVWLTQLSMLLADSIVFAALTELGPRPDVVAGHSFGEFPALVAAGAWTLEEAIHATRVRCRSIQASSGAGGVLMATSAPPETIEQAAKGLCAHVAIRNTPGQTIVGGERAALEQVRERLASAGFGSQMLAVPGPFHTPLLEDVRKPLARAFAELDLRPPATPFLSGVTNRYAADPMEIRHNMAAQLATPLNYVELVRRLAAGGVTMFVEVGPKQVLTRLHERILAELPGLTFVACDHPQRPGAAQLRHIAAMVAANQPAAAPEAPEILHFDATQRRRQKRQTAPAAPEPEPETAPAAAAPAPDEMAAHLIQLVCERTGYSPDLVGMDADLEADLGLDSISKVQLFIELGDHFDLGDIREQRFENFRTIRHVVDYLRSRKEKEAPAPALAAAPAAADSLGILRLRGTPYEMGLEHARKLGGEIKAIIGRYNEILGGNAGERADLQTAMANAEAYFGASGLEELRGLADGCGLPFHFVAGYNLALIPELVPGCAHFVAGGPAGLIHGLNEDAPLSLRLGRPLAPVAALRHPREGIPHLSFVLPGQFAGINGINARGLAVSSTMLLDQAPPSVASPGRTHATLVKEVLERAEDIGAAVEMVRGARRFGACSLLLSHHPSGRVCYIEYAGEAIAVRESVNSLAGTNHSLMLPAANGVPEHSLHRLARLEGLLKPEGNCTPGQAQAALRDRHDPARGREATQSTMSTVRRVDNLLSLVIRPDRGEAWLSAGPRSETYERLDVRDLLDSAVMRRWVMRTVPAPLERVGTASFSGPTLVLGDSPVAKALRARLGELGSAVRDLPALDDPAEVLRALERVWQDGPAPHLFLMGGAGVLLPFRVCQRWLQLLVEAHMAEGATLVAVTSLGGDFGFSGRVGAAEGGGLAGLLKAIRREFPGLCVKVVDAPAEEPPDRLAGSILAELAARNRETEVAYRAGGRSVVRTVRRAAKPGAPVHLTPGGVWIATGGARGITAYVAAELGRRFGLNLHLLGRSPSAELSFPASYHRCDVSDESGLDAVLGEIRRAHGPIRGILHGAGVEAAAPFERKSLETARATIAAKVEGAALLMKLTREDPLEAFIAFGSVSGRFGGHGQADYSLASDMLAKMVQGFRAERPECASVTFHWPAWDEIGMAVRPESRVALELAGQRFMPPAEGIEHLLAELQAGAPEGEVLIVDGPGILDLDGSMRPDLPLASGLPLIEGLVTREEQSTVAEIRFDPARDFFLKDHRYQGIPLLPGVAGMEALAEGAALAGQRAVTALRQVEFRQALRFPGELAQRARVIARRAGSGFECRLVVAFRDSEGKLLDPERVVVRADAECDDEAALPQFPAPSGVEWHRMEYPDSGPMIHGPSLRSLEELAWSGDGICGRILAPPCDGGWTVPAAVLDACLVACGAFAWKTLGVYSLPRGIQLLRLGRRPKAAERCLVQVHFHGREERTLRFDFTLAGGDGATLLHAEGYEATSIAEGGAE